MKDDDKTRIEGTKVSILIPVFNREKMLIASLSSAINQTYKNMEIVVVDNASTDGTWNTVESLAKKDSRVKVFRNAENVGPVRNWLECLRHASGEYVKFLWSDDWIDEDFLEKTIPFLSDSEVGFAFSPAKIINSDSGSRETAYDLFKGDTVFSSRVFIEYCISGGKTPVSPGCAIFRKEDVEQSLLIDIPNESGLDFSRYGAGNDLLIMLLPLLSYPRVAFVRSTCSYFLAHKESFSVSNDLDAYYDWARLHFLNLLEDPRLLSVFKTRQLLKKLVGKSSKNLYKAIPGRILFGQAISMILGKLFRKLRTKFNH